MSAVWEWDMQFLQGWLVAFAISVPILEGSEYNPKPPVVAVNCSLHHPPLSLQRSNGGMEHLHL